MSRFRPPISGRKKKDPPGWSEYCDRREQWKKDDLEYWFKRFAQIEDKREAFDFMVRNQYKISDPVYPDFGTGRGEWKTKDWSHVRL